MMNQNQIPEIYLEVPEPLGGVLTKFPKIKPLSDYLSGAAAVKALKSAVAELTAAAPPDCDVLIEAFGLLVYSVQYKKPHTIIFRGRDSAGQEAFQIFHFSQLVARVVYQAKRGPERVITGFSKSNT